MSKDFSSFFTSLGLSSSETRVYLASLNLGPTSVQAIAKKAKLSRTATYDAIGSLQERGLISTYERGKKRYFSAEDPENAVAHFKEHIEKMEKQLGALTRLLPELKMMTGGERPSVRFYEGKEAIYALFNDVAKVDPKVIYEVSNIDAVYGFLDQEALADAQKLLKKEKIEFRMLHRGKLRNPSPTFKYRELRPEFGDFKGDIWTGKGDCRQRSSHKNAGIPGDR